MGAGSAIDLVLSGGLGDLGDSRYTISFAVTILGFGANGELHLEQVNLLTWFSSLQDGQGLIALGIN